MEVPALAEARRIAVIGGGGLMGHGIVMACLLGSPGAEVVLISRRPATLEHGLELVRSGPFGLAGLVRRQRLTEADVEAALARLQTTTDLAEGVRGSDLIFETVPEVVSLKHEVLQAAEAAAPAGAVLATNTSSILIAELGGVLRRPERLIGTHWFYPANVMPLVEVVRGERTAPAVVEAVTAYLRQIGKQPVVVRDSPGFFMTRFINLFIAEAITAVQNGVCRIEDVDAMVKTGLGWPMGVFELLDRTAAFDSWYHAQAYLHATLGERFAIPPLARQVFAAGYRGTPALKPGSRGGWYDFFAHGGEADA